MPERGRRRPAAAASIRAGGVVVAAVVAAARWSRRSGDGERGGAVVRKTRKWPSRQDPGRMILKNSKSVKRRAASRMGEN
uniref:Uncharacterized protein n=1 Tax=Oryza barthii TaxID=65489 RepID=A0A0D3FFC7_9ORYZ